MSYDTPLSPQGQQLADLPMREQLRKGFKDMGSRSYSSAKNFALVGAIFSGTECCIEGVRFTSIYTLEIYFLTFAVHLVPGQERPEEWCSRWVYNRRCLRSKGRSTSSSCRVCWICGLQCCNRLLYEAAVRLKASGRTLFYHLNSSAGNN